MKYKSNIKKTWEIIKKYHWKTKLININLPNKLIVNGRNIID